MRVLSKLRFRTKITLGMTAVILFFALALSWPATRMTTDALMEELRTRDRVLARNLAARAAGPMLASDLLRLKNMVDDLKKVDGVEYAFFLDAKGRIAAHTFAGGFPVELVRVNPGPASGSPSVVLLETGDGRIYDAAAPILIEGVDFGRARVGLSRTGQEARVRRLLLYIAAATGVALFLAVGAGVLFSRRVTRRLNLLRRHAEEVVTGDLDIRAGRPLYKNCWEIMDCGLENCPAHGDRERRCWYLAGTLCPDCRDDGTGDIRDSCSRCPVYRANKGDEIQDLAEAFDVMTLTLKARIKELRAVRDGLIQAQKMESVGKLAGGVAHEINTPLGIILGYAQLLQEDVPEDEEMRRDLEIIEKQAKVCRKIVADLLGFSRRAESEKLEMCFNNSLMEAVSLVRHTFEMERVSIVTRLDDRMPIIYGDPEKLKQVWINLLNNARDAMPAGGTILVASELKRGEQIVTAKVADTGSGIAEADLKRIFDPFFTTKSVGSGTGLGLSVSFGIIKDHRGTIGAKSPAPPGFFEDPEAPVEHGPGTVVTVGLPLDHGSTAGEAARLRDEAGESRQ